MEVGAECVAEEEALHRRFRLAILKAATYKQVKVLLIVVNDQRDRFTNWSFAAGM